MGTMLSPREKPVFLRETLVIPMGMRVILMGPPISRAGPLLEKATGGPPKISLEGLVLPMGTLVILMGTTVIPLATLA